MAKKHRYILTEIWDESWFGELSPLAKLVYLYLITNPSTNLAGVYQKREKAIAFECSLKNASDPLKELKDCGEVICENDYVMILRHPEFQKWEINDSIAKGIVSDLNSVPPEIIEILRNSNYRYQPIKDEASFEKEQERLFLGFSQREQRKKEKEHNNKKNPHPKPKRAYTKDSERFTDHVPFGDEE